MFNTKENAYRLLLNKDISSQNFVLEVLAETFNFDLSHIDRFMDVPHTKRAYLQSLADNVDKKRAFSEPKDVYGVSGAEAFEILVEEQKVLTKLSEVHTMIENIDINGDEDVLLFKTNLTICFNAAMNEYRHRQQQLLAKTNILAVDQLSFDGKGTLDNFSVHQYQHKVSRPEEAVSKLKGTRDMAENFEDISQKFHPVLKGISLRRTMAGCMQGRFHQKT